MNFKKLTLTFCLTFAVFLSFSQKTATYTTELKDYKRAVNLYNERSYSASQQLFNQIKSNFDSTTELRANCDFYIANCAIRLGQQNGDDLMLDFVTNYPTSTKQNNAFLETAEYYYKAGKYPYALKWYGKVETYNLTNYQKEDYNFKFGYCLFATQNYTKSKEYFGEILDSKKYGSQAKYYYGYMAYADDDYETADNYLGQVVTDASYKNKVSYYLADMNFKAGKFETAIEKGEPLLERSKREEHSQLSKIIGESYFNLNKYAEAIPHLKNYKGTRGKWNNTDYYMLGYAYYKQDDFENAIAHFNKIIDGKNSVAQNAYYHLAQCYLHLDKKSEALNAFRNAKDMDFDEELEHDAHLNYAKLSYEIGNPYNSVPDVLQDYLSKHPNTIHDETIEKLLVSSYITSQDYNGALNYLEGKKDTNSKSFYQLAAFYSGITFFNNDELSKAIENFEKSLTTPIDNNLTAKANYWKGEANFRLNRFDAAETDFDLFIKNIAAKDTEEFDDFQYQIAYVYFNQKNYVDAAEAYKKYIAQNPNDQLKLNDSYSRMADTYFVSSDYENAIDSYDKIIKNSAADADYAQFQKAVSYGYIRQDDRKIEELNTFIRRYPKSTLQDDAHYVLANEYVDANENRLALETYDKLITNFEHSPFVSKAMLKKSVVYYNNEQNDNALNTYKRVVKKYPNTPEAKQAVTSARQIYVDLGRVDEYAAWVKTIDFINVSDADLDNDTYESAERQYLQSNHKRAITGFQKYVRQFPTGLHSLQANYYLAESLYAEDNLNETIPYYKFVTEQGQNEFTEQALSRLALAYLKSDNWDAAIPTLKRLEEVSNNPQNSIFAQTNLMKGYYVQENYEQAVSYADNVLSQVKIDDNIKSDAQIIIARSAIKTDDSSKARQAYSELDLIATGELKAEALYYKAYFEHMDGSYRVSNEIVQDIAANYSTYKYWGAKGLIIMAKNHYELKDAFQATYILESVQKNFAQFDDVVEEANKALEIIKTNEAKTNDSVKPGN
ncbi:MAG: hypothetical protein BM563_11170 [Bacteroidetes bacterium MedPE-SWsnd-G1]|nr:MAG: hypothetical protein BM563_11170 [Bacteroidetes bacterium MedPE-SWsnd-G1]